MIQQLTKTRELLTPLLPDQEQILCNPALDPRALADLLIQLYRSGVWLRCECGWVLHFRGGHTLARNPRQSEPDCEPCALCLAWPYQRGPLDGGGEGESRPGERGLTVFSTGRRRTRQGAAPVVERGERGAASMKHRSMYQVLWTVMDEAGFLSLRGPVEASALWERVREVLSLTPLHDDDPEGPSFADLVWLPDSEETPRETLSRVRSVWRHAGAEPQVWIWAIIPEIPTARAGLLELELGGVHHTVQISLLARNRTRVGRSGPYLVLIQATRDSDGGSRCDKLAAQAILAADCPVPVDSSHEREAIRVVQELCMRYYKPVFPYADNLQPDLMLLDSHLIVEVMGMHMEGYDQHKEEIMARMRHHPALRGWRIVPHRPNRGETPGELKMQLRRWWHRSPKERSHRDPGRS